MGEKEKLKELEEKLQKATGAERAKLLREINQLRRTLGMLDWEEEKEVMPIKPEFTKIYEHILTNYDDWEEHASPHILLWFDKDAEDKVSDIHEVIHCWYHDSLSDMWRKPFHWIETELHIKPVADFVFMDFGIDMGSANYDEALEALAERLFGYGLEGLFLDLDIDEFFALYAK